MVAAARIGKGRDGDGDVIVATGPVRSTTTIFGRDRCFKDGAISDVLLMMMLSVAEMVPRGRVTRTKLPRRWISWCGGLMTEHSYTRVRLRWADDYIYHEK